MEGKPQVEVRFKTKACPFCAEEILAAAVKCKHCGSMLDGSAPGVTVRGADPFAEYHTAIKGKAKGKVTVIGWLGMGLGVLMIFVAGAALLNADESQMEGLAMLGLIGLGAIIASFLWARR